MYILGEHGMHLPSNRHWPSALAAGMIMHVEGLGRVCVWACHSGQDAAWLSFAHACHLCRAILPHKDSKNYKVLLKAIVRLACAPLNSDQAKEVEDVAGTARVEKQKAEKAKLLEKKPIKKSLGGVGKGGAAGLDEMIYDDDYDDGEDFM